MKIDRNISDKKNCKISLFHSDISGISFDEKGISNYAKKIQWKLKNEIFNDPELLKKKIDRIRYAGRNND